MKHMVDTISVLYPGWHLHSSTLNKCVHVVIVLYDERDGVGLYNSG